MSASLSYFCFFDQIATTRAGLILLLIDLKIVLEIPATIDPIDAGAFLINAFC